MTDDALKGYVAALRDQATQIATALNGLVRDLEDRETLLEKLDVAHGVPCKHPIAERSMLSRAGQLPIQYCCKLCQSVIVEEKKT